MTTPTQVRTMDASQVRSIVDDLATARRDLTAARSDLHASEAELVHIKRAVTAHLLAVGGGVIPGKSDADRNRVIDDALIITPAYQTCQEAVDQARQKVARLSTEVEVLSDYFALARMESRDALTYVLGLVSTPLITLNVGDQPKIVASLNDV